MDIKNFACRSNRFKSKYRQLVPLVNYGKKLQLIYVCIILKPLHVHCGNIGIVVVQTPELQLNYLTRRYFTNHMHIRLIFFSDLPIY